VPPSLPLLLSVATLLACHHGADPGDTGWVAPGCGDGVLAADEECDEGAANSDTTPDACRSTCLSPGCGDGVVDAGEACDDGGPWGGDGCDPSCAAEDGQLESEPQDSWDTAQSTDGRTIFGALPAGDIDCYAVELSDCAALDARLVAPTSGRCADPATLRLHDPTGAEVAVGTPAEDGCARLDPAEAEGARFVSAGSWSVCVAGLAGGEVPAYALRLDPVAPKDAHYTVDPADDPDGDGFPDRCDLDRDGDGIDNEADDCPDVADGPDAAPLGPDADGFLRDWLAVGPFTGNSSPDTCLPSELDLVAADDATARPALGDRVDITTGQAQWHALWARDSRVELLDDFGAVDAPREAYLAVYVYSPAERSLSLALGPDDGARAWLDGVEVLDISSCQGTNIDQFQAEVVLHAGWQPLLLKIFDQGGGFGVYARFLEGGSPVTDLDLSLDPAGAWSPQPADSDGDGLGDVCDPTPAG